MPSQAVLELLVTLKDQASSGLSSLGSALGNVGMIAGGAALAGVAAFGAAVVAGVGDAREAAKIMAQTENVIRSTGGAAGVTAQQVADMAASLSAASGKSLFGDDDIQQSTNLLLTFTNIKDSALEAATAISVDMAQALGGAPKDAAIQLGKALNDPINGVSALSRVGVSFTEQQKEQIKAMQEAGDMAGAQAVILAELNKEFGGSAQAAADADGGWAQFNDRLGEARETLGAAVLPLLAQVGGFLLDNVVPAVEAGAQAFANLVGYFSAVAEDGDYLNDFLGNLPPSIQPIVEAIGFMVTQFQIAGDETNSFVEQLGYFVDSLLGVEEGVVGPFQTAMLALQGAFEDGGLQGAIQFLIDKVSEISPVFQLVVGIVESVLPPLQAIVEAVFGAVAEFIAENGDEIMAFVKSAWEQIHSIIELTLQIIQATVVPILTAIAAFIASHGEQIQAILKATWDYISGVIGAALGLIQGLLKTVLLAINGDWSGAWEMLKQTSATFVQAILDTVTNVLHDLEGVFEDVINSIQGAWDDLVNSAATIGSNIIQGIISGVQGARDQLIAVMVDMAKAAWEAVKEFFGIQSPSRLMAESIGAPIVAGIAQGLIDALPNLMSQLDNLGDDVVDKMRSIGDMVQKALGSAFNAEGTIDRQIAKNLSSIEQVSEGLRNFVQNSLADATKQASQFADPATGAKFLKMRSDQIFELAKLQDQINASTDAKERERLRAQYQLIIKAQNAEQLAFRANDTGTTSPQERVFKQIQALIASFAGANPTDAQISAIGTLQGWADQLTAGSGAFNLPMPAPAGGPAGPIDSRGFPTTVININLPAGTTREVTDEVMRRLNQQITGRR